MTEGFGTLRAGRPLGLPEGPPSWRDLPLPVLLAGAQLAAGTGMGAQAEVSTGMSTGVACAALVFRTSAPVLALVATLAAVPMGAWIAAGQGVVVPAVAVLVGLYTLAVRRTAGPSVAGAAAAVVVATGTAAALAGSPRDVAGTALVAAGGAAVAWAAGRSRRRRRASRTAVAAYRAGAAEVPRFAALAERDRLAAELHDVCAHRLTGIVVSAAAALRLADPERSREALRHATDAGRQAVAELDRLTALEAPDTSATADTADPLADLRALAADHGASHVRTADAAPPQLAALAYRVAREALTNAARYAAGATVRVHVGTGTGTGTATSTTGTETGTGLTVTVTDSGGTAAAPGLGTGHGLTGLRTAVAAAGGTLVYGPTGGGWTVHAELPAAAPPVTRRWPRWRGPGALDWALVVLAVALSLGAGLLSAGSPDDSFVGLLPAVSVVALSGLHALPLGWRSRFPGRALAAVLLALVLWQGCDLAGWTRPPVSDVFLVYGWVELTLVYSVGCYLPARSGPPAALAVAAVGGLALAGGSGITGDRAAAWAVLSAGLAVPTFAVWSLGLLAGARRTRRTAATARSRRLLEHEADTAVREQRRRVAAGLRRTARGHAWAVVAAADAGRLETVLAEARSALTALRKDLADLRGPRDGAPPPTVAGIAVLAGRYGGTVRLSGAALPAPPAVEVAAFRAAALLMTEGVALGVLRGEEGIEVRGPRPAEFGVERRLRALADAAGGTLSTAGDGRVRVWLPEVLPSRCPR